MTTSRLPHLVKSCTVPKFWWTVGCSNERLLFFQLWSFWAFLQKYQFFKHITRGKERCYLEKYNNFLFTVHVEKKNKMLDECSGRENNFVNFSLFLFEVSPLACGLVREERIIFTVNERYVSYQRCIYRKSSKHSHLTHITQHHRKKMEVKIHKIKMHDC